MQLYNQIAFRENPKLYNYLKQNSYYFKNLNRDFMDYKIFEREMKNKYKERTTDKLTSAVENIELISSVLNIFK